MKTAPLVALGARMSSIAGSAERRRPGAPRVCPRCRHHCAVSTGESTTSAERARWSTSRVEAFSDGVFAIAITLLVLDLGVPARDYTHLLHGIEEQWPEYLGYLTSFLTIGSIWLNHHALFRRLRYANGQLMSLNLVLLMAVAFLPFPTRLVAGAIRDVDAERTAVLFYGASLLTISLIYAALWAVAARNRALLEPDVSDEELAMLVRASRPSVALYIVAIGLAIVTPHVAAVLYLVIACASVARAQSERL